MAETLSEQPTKKAGGLRKMFTEGLRKVRSERGTQVHCDVVGDV